MRHGVSTTDCSLPLFDWPMACEVMRLEEERRVLKSRIDGLKPHSHKRIELEFRLKQVTQAQLALYKDSRHG